MKILHVISGVYKESGGTSEVVPRMCEALKVQGHDVRILTLDWGAISTAAERAMAAGVEIVCCKRNDVLVGRGLGFSTELARRAVDGVRWADVIHLHGLWQWPCWRVAAEAQRQHKPYVMQTHGFLEPERLKKSAFKKKVIGRLIERPRLARASRIIATAESERESILAYGVKTPIEIVPIGMDTAEIDRASRDEALIDRLTGGAARKPGGGRKKILLFFSRIAPIKGLDMLADAWAQLKEFHADWQLVIAGPNDRGYESVVKADFAAKVTDGSVSFPGPVYGLEKFALLKSVEGFVLPTRSENWSIAVAEAMANRLPVVCTKGAPWKCLSDDHAGWWVDTSAEGIYSGLSALLNTHPEERHLMGCRGRKWVEENLSWKSIAKTLIECYQIILKGL